MISKENHDKDEFKIYCGKRIKEFRESVLKTNQADAALKLGIKQSHFAQIENGGKQIQINQLKFVHDLGGDLNYVIGGTGSVRRGVNTSELCKKAAEKTIEIMADRFYSSSKRPDKSDLIEAAINTLNALSGFYSSPQEEASKIDLIEAHEKALQPLRDIFE